jgi:hypothetical protein
MPELTPAIPLNLQLWYGDVLVADLVDLFPHQGTWFAEYRQIVEPQNGSLFGRLSDYIQFCEHWHERLNKEGNPDPSEFDQYSDLIGSSMWRVPCPDGSELRTDGAPVFTNGEVSWNHPEVAPSTELSARETWARLTGNSSFD